MTRVYLVTGTWPGGRKLARLVTAEDSDQAIAAAGLSDAPGIDVWALDGSLHVVA
jgi:hypothetical protein